MNLSLDEIVLATNGKILIQNNQGNFNRVSTDTRNIKDGDLFIALKGDNFNGNNYAINAIEKGASIVIIDEIKFEINQLNSEATIIKVDDTKKALGDLAKYYRNKLGIKVVGITGSTGKTSTKDLVAAFLSGKYKVFKTKGNFNNEIGLPLMIFQLTSDYDIAVLEMGMSNFGEINRLANIARPNVAAITNIGVAHIEYLKTRENILKEKMSITDFFSNDNTLVLNFENDMLKTVKETDEFKLKKIGYNKEYDVYAQNLIISENSTSFEAITNDEKSHRFTLNMVGEHNVLNALLGIQIAREFDVTFDQMEAGLKNFEATSMRLEFIKKEEFTIINDCYNANPDSMKAALNVLKNYSGKRKIAVLGTMGELGDYAKNAHREIGKFANGKADILLSTGEFKEEYKEGFGDNTIVFKTKEQLLEGLKQMIKKEDTILIKASRSAKFEEVIKALDSKCN